jgi:hypothetical protein
MDDDDVRDLVDLEGLAPLGDRAIDAIKRMGVSDHGRQVQIAAIARRGDSPMTK